MWNRRGQRFGAEEVKQFINQKWFFFSCYFCVKDSHNSVSVWFLPFEMVLSFASLCVWLCFKSFSICTYEETYNFHNNKLYTRMVYTSRLLLSTNNRENAPFNCFAAWEFIILLKNMTTHHNLLHVNRIECRAFQLNVCGGWIVYCKNREEISESRNNW